MGTKKFDQILVVDIECTAWEPREAQGEQPSEIIEIGICRLKMDSFEITDKISYMVRPKYSEVTEFCTSLTGLTWNDVKIGMPFANACNKLFKNFGTSNRVWASWGDGDREQFLCECKEKNARYPFSQTHINASALFSLMTGQKQRISVSNALKKIGLEFVGQVHSGADDAYNTARILRHLMKSETD